MSGAGPHPKRRLAVIVAAVLLGTAAMAATAVLAVRYVLRQDLVESAEAQTVIRIAKLRGAAERLGAHARGFLLTADADAFHRVQRDRDQFFVRLDDLVESSAGNTHQRLEAVRAATRRYDEALDSVMALRRRAESADVVARAFQERIRPAQQAVDEALATLVDSEETRLHSLDRSTERTAARVATMTAGVAVGALAVSLAMGILLARAFASLADRRAALEQALAQVARTNADLEAFASRIAHDVRTPLTPIALMADKLKRSTDPAVVRAAERIDRSARNASLMVEDLLTFSRLGRRTEGATVRAAPAVRSILDDYAEKIAAAGIDVTCELDDRVLVACSESLFRQIAGNLIGNALKFVEGRPERRVRLQLTARGDSCLLDVADSGPGIPSEALPHIFDSFYRVPGSQAAGHGLGLAIVRRIVDAHGGRLTVESTLGQGTTFRVVLPEARPAPSAHAVATPATPPA